VVLNSKSGRGSVRDIWDDDIRPVFQYAAHIYDDPPLKVLMTDAPEDAKTEVQSIDLSSIDGLCVVGGDGLMQEVRCPDPPRTPHPTRAASSSRCLSDERRRAPGCVCVRRLALL
jgi:hypothetical protein